MFRKKRLDTTVGSLEDTYGINLNARRDMLLGNVLAERGFTSFSQLLKAYRGNATEMSCRRRVFTSFDYADIKQIQGLRLMLDNPNVSLDFTDMGLRAEINSERAGYVKQRIREIINRASVTLCLIGNATAFSEWVRWELETARYLHKGLCGVRLKDSRGRSPATLKETHAPVVTWGARQTIAAIECAAARRS